jgi:hypothetical protein
LARSLGKELPQVDTKSGLFGITTLLGIALIGSTLAISPWTNFDPINLPKQLVLAASAFAIIPYLFFLPTLFQKSLLIRVLFSVSLIFLFGNVVILFTNTSPLNQQIWGTFGRSNGLLCLLSLLLIFWGSVFAGIQDKAARILRFLVLAGYFVSGYTLIQYMGLDPLPWSQMLPISFLGNINFMSSFLGLVNIYTFSRLVLERDSSLHKAHLLVIFAFNSCLILASGSIQGLGITAIGIVTSLTFLLRKNGKIFISFAFFMPMCILGLIGLLGTAGIGPLRNFLVQETVVFRTDYWRAGWAIFVGNFWDGVGIDSLGDYYTEYRDSLAATRTGPSRVVNTSHNVFLDLYANGGVVVGTSFLLLVLITTIYCLKSSLRVNSSHLEMHLGSLILGWIFFLTISINQIGVTVWGFAFMGLAIGMQMSAQEPDKVRSKKSNYKLKIEREKRDKLASSLLGLLGLLIATIPFRADAMFLSALKSGSPERLKVAVNQIGTSEFHKNKYLESVLKFYGSESAVRVANEMLKENSRNSFAWSVIADSPDSVMNIEQKFALEMLLSLDPNNLEIQARLKSKK